MEQTFYYLRSHNWGTLYVSTPRNVAGCHNYSIPLAIDGMLFSSVTLIEPAAGDLYGRI